LHVDAITISKQLLHTMNRVGAKGGTSDHA